MPEKKGMTRGPSKGGGGRPSGLTREVFRLIERALAAGALQRDAWRMAGLSKATYYEWLERGRQSPAGDLYRDFADMVSKARASAKVDALTRIRTAMSGDWKAAAWWLGVTDPAHYSPRVRLALHQEYEGVLNRLEQRLSPALYEQVLHAVVGDDDGSVIEAVEAEALLPVPSEKEVQDHR